MSYDISVHVGGLQASNPDKIGSSLAKLIYEQTIGSLGDIKYHMEGYSVVYELDIIEGGNMGYVVTVKEDQVEVKPHA